MIPKKGARPDSDNCSDWLFPAVIKIIAQIILERIKKQEDVVGFSGRWQFLSVFEQIDNADGVSLFPRSGFEKED